MNGTWTSILAAVISAVLGGAGIVAMVNAIANRKVRKIDVSDRLNDSTLEWAQALKADTREARADAREARQDAAECRRVSMELQQKFEQLNRDLRVFRAAVWQQGMTMETLQKLVAEQDHI